MATIITTVPPRNTREFNKYAAEVMLFEGAIELRGGEEGNWQPILNPVWNWDRFDYRKSPIIIRPWLVAEVPLGKILRYPKPGINAPIRALIVDAYLKDDSVCVKLGSDFEASASFLVNSGIMDDGSPCGIRQHPQ